MLHVRFDCGVTEKHPMCPDIWDEMGTMAVWCIYDPQEIDYIETILYVYPPPIGG